MSMAPTCLSAAWQDTLPVPGTERCDSCRLRLGEGHRVQVLVEHQLAAASGSIGYAVRFGFG